LYTSTTADRYSYRHPNPYADADAAADTKSNSHGYPVAYPSSGLEHLDAASG
jgi:hypothetical protein